MNKNRIVFFAILSGVACYAGMLSMFHIFRGLLPEDGQTQFVLQYVAVALTLVAVYGALRLFRCNVILRMAILELPLLLDVTLWDAYPDVPSFFYLALMAALALVFVFPSKNTEVE